MDFNVRGMEVTVHNDNIRELEEHIKSVGCKRPYQPTNYRWPVCTNKTQMKKPRTWLLTGGIPPCRGITSIHYQMGEIEKGNFPMPLQGKDWKYWFGITLRFFNRRFRTTLQKKEVDFQNLVGYVGGYVGMIMGFALVQIPELMFATLIYVKQLYERIFKRNSAEVGPIQIIADRNKRVPLRVSEPQQAKNDAKSEIDDKIRQICNSITNQGKDIDAKLENELRAIRRRIDKMEERINIGCFLDQQMNKLT